MRAVAVCLALLVAQRATADDELDELPSPGSRYFLSGGLGLAVRDADTTNTLELVKMFSFGVPTGERRQLIVTFETADADVEGMMPHRNHGSTLIGLRTTPWAPKREKSPIPLPTRFLDLRALHVTAQIGVETRRSITYEMGETFAEDTRGPVMGVGAGWMMFQTRDWTFSFEVSARFSRNVTGNELAYGYSFVVYLMK